MRRFFVAATAALVFPLIASAKPLITSSEDTLARVCLAQEDSAERLVSACSAALDAANLTGSQRVELLVALGDAQSWNNLDSQAEETYQRALSLDPRALDAWNGLGWILRGYGNEAEALAAFENSLAIDVSVQGLAGKATTARATGAIGGDESRQMLEAALAIDPKYIWAIREIAWSHFEESNFDMAMKRFNEALSHDADDVNALFGKGRSALKLSQNQVALDSLNAALAQAPNHYSARVYRIIALRDLDRNAQALRDADRLIADYPDRTSGYIEKGLALVALERRAEAIQTLSEADALLGPKNAILYWYADVLITDGQMSEALAVIDRGIQLDGVDHTDFLLKSYIALELNDYPMALQAAEASLETGVEDPWAHYYIAIAMVHGGSAKEGIERFNTAIQTGLPQDRVGAFARELISAGKYVEAAQLRLKY
ncbi:MAG: tetratricopeptide repeat protein [Boseongicola sp.]|nr:tetratricopeptide repeat protein [Boseongicola sp.]MDD9976614.1 tetratricopeptide repeat protein [Boseongicola sp.]